MDSKLAGCRPIKTVVRCYNDMVLVFDRYGEQVLQFQGAYADVRAPILAAAPADAIFALFTADGGELKTVDRASW